MATIYSTVLRKEIAKGNSGELMKKTAQDRVQVQFDDAVIGMNKDFEEHPITKEIAGGIASSNISETLGGGPAPRNLFSFIGFPSEEGDPTDKIRKNLDPSAPGGPTYVFEGKDSSNPLVYKFRVYSPDLEAIYEKTPMPWGPGLSWAEKIEGSIPGLAQFLSKFIPEEKSRSGGGLQVKSDLRPGDDYKAPTDGYLSTIFKNFVARVGLGTKGARQGR